MQLSGHRVYRHILHCLAVRVSSNHIFNLRLLIESHMVAVVGNVATTGLALVLSTMAIYS